MQGLERDSLGLNPDCITYQIYTLGKFINQSALVYSEVQ